VKVVKSAAIIILVLLVAAQFYRPAKNFPQTPMTAGMDSLYPIPPEIEATFRVACYDCHTDSTRYPWYSEIQPVGWWLNNHIRDGKRHLNFSEFASYRLRRQYGKFDDIITEVSEGGMPLPSYLIAHNDARLTQEQRDRIVAWAKAMKDTMKAHYPLDSLVRKNPPPSPPR
jgi:hypothetical protein